jgi:formylglycine-generating enzyme required for sulfatase activity
VLSLAASSSGLIEQAQTPAGLDAQLYAGLTVTGEIGAVYQIQCVTDLAQASNPDAWHCLEFLQLPTSPYLWTDKSSPATAHRFYQAVVFAAPTNMIFIPPGTFRMGSPTNEPNRSIKEGPQTDVTISRGFWIGKYLLTQGEYQSLMGNNPSFFNTNNGFSQDLTRPVDSATWFDASEYCTQLTRKERARGHIPADSLFRLPTEAEWEYACRAWTSTAYSYGDDPGYSNLVNYAWFHANSAGMTHPVGQKLPNPWGLYDMHGMLEEWCQDWFASYAGGSLIDPQGSATGTLKVIRGGFWEDTASYCRSASRNEHDPLAQHYHLGFRLVLAPSSP